MIRHEQHAETEQSLSDPAVIVVQIKVTASASVKKDAESCFTLYFNTAIPDIAFCRHYRALGCLLDGKTCRDVLLWT